MSRADNVIDDYDDDFPIETKRLPKKPEVKVDHQNGACIPLGCLCVDSIRIQAEKKAATPPPQTNYALIEKLSGNLLLYVEAQKIMGIDEMVSQLRASDAATKLLFINTYLCPRVVGLRNDIKIQMPAATPEQQDKVARFLEAM